VKETKKRNHKRNSPTSREAESQEDLKEKRNEELIQQDERKENQQKKEKKMRRNSPTSCEAESQEDLKERKKKKPLVKL
jgi:hypothetical protein